LSKGFPQQVVLLEVAEQQLRGIQMLPVVRQVNDRSAYIRHMLDCLGVEVLGARVPPYRAGPVRGNPFSCHRADDPRISASVALRTLGSQRTASCSLTQT